MQWTLVVAKRARKEFEKAPAKSQRLLGAALEEMRQDPFSGDIVRLAGERASWRRRVGAYRILFDLNLELRPIEVIEIVRRTSTTYR